MDAHYFMFLLSTYPKGKPIQLKTIHPSYKHADEKLFVKLSDDAWEKYKSNKEMKEFYKYGYNKKLK